MNMCDVPFTMKMKSVIAGEYTAPPAHGPRITLICGMTPDAFTLRKKMPPYAGERDDAFLDARAGAVVEADQRRADRLGEVHHLVDLLGEHLAERAAEDREVLARRRRPCGRRPCPSR